MVDLQEPMREILRTRLLEDFVPYLPELLGNQHERQNIEDKQVSRAFNAFVLHAKFGLTPEIAASMVVDDFQDNGIDAIYYHPEDNTLYLLQSKLRSGNFTLPEARKFIAGVSLLVNQEYQQFNQNVQNRQNEIDAALDRCDSIQLLIDG